MLLSSVALPECCTQIFQSTGAGVCTKGRYVPPGQQPREGERALYLQVTVIDSAQARAEPSQQAKSQSVVDAAVRALRELMTPTARVTEHLQVNIAQDAHFRVVDRVSGPGVAYTAARDVVDLLFTG